MKNFLVNTAATIGVLIVYFYMLIGGAWLFVLLINQVEILVRSRI